MTRSGLLRGDARLDLWISVPVEKAFGGRATVAYACGEEGRAATGSCVDVTGSAEESNAGEGWTADSGDSPQYKLSERGV